MASTTYPYLAPRLREVYSCTSTPPCGPRGLFKDENDLYVNLQNAVFESAVGRVSFHRHPYKHIHIQGKRKFVNRLLKCNNSESRKHYATCDGPDTGHRQATEVITRPKTTCVSGLHSLFEAGSAHKCTGKVLPTTGHEGSEGGGVEL